MIPIRFILYKARPCHFNKKYMDPSFLKSRSGIAALALAIFVALFIFATIILLTGQGNNSISSGIYGSQADKAKYLSETGIQDGKLRIARNKNINTSYTITETDGTIDVKISTTSNTQFIVVSTGTVSGAGVTTQWAKQAQITIDTDGKIASSSEIDL